MIQKACTIFFILFALIVFGCGRSNKVNCAFTACTLDFKYITVSIKQSTDSTGVKLTSYKVLRVSDNKDLTISDNILDGNSGYYPLINDNDRDILRNANVEIEFQGYIGSTLIIKDRFIVTADCCHVSLVAGDPVIYI